MKIILIKSPTIFRLVFIHIQFGILLFLVSCNASKSSHDASGTFEIKETLIAAEANGILKQLDIFEGQNLDAGQNIGFIDTVQLYLKKKQLLAQIRTTMSQKPDIQKQLGAINVQLEAARKEQHRINNLVKVNAATQKQLDDVNAQVETLKMQFEAQQSALGITIESIGQQANPLLVQIEQLDDQLLKCRIINPVQGTVLNKFSEVNEMAVIGKPLYKIADLSTLVLRAYITANQLSAIKLDQKIKVLVDGEANITKEYEGIIEWISSKAEFTPKTIQTKDERANLVYAIKVRVKNDGMLKIGMYADILF